MCMTGHTNSTSFAEFCQLILSRSKSASFGQSYLINLAAPSPSRFGFGGLDTSQRALPVSEPLESLSGPILETLDE